jgi:putative PIN family toxin of toxin-antitoxin system
MVDTNIIISASLFPGTIVGNVFTHIINNHELVLSKYTLDELKNVFQRKFPDKIRYLDKFIKNLKYELVKFGINDLNKYPKIRDIKDIPLLAYAIESKVDILLTGDKDFVEINIENINIINPRKYFEEYMGN